MAKSGRIERPRQDDGRDCIARARQARAVATPERERGRCVEGRDVAAVVYTIGHSTRPLATLVEMLTAHGVLVLADVRTVPRSRHNPQFNRESLPAELHQAGIRYVHLPRLGGLRHGLGNASPNMGWRNKSFRGYADYMQTEEFLDGLSELIGIARERTTAIMCAEAVPYRCHRSLIADALMARGIEVREISSKTRAALHRMTPFAKVEGSHVTYPAE